MNEIKELCGVDIKENYIYSLDKAVLALLLKDRSSGKNIIWATDTYAWRGAEFEPQDCITVKSITGKRGNVIKPRTQKSQKEQRKRIKNKAEVFTPSWICCEMANKFDEVWFGRKNVFNTPSGKTWKVNENRIEFGFNDCNAWQDYVRLRVLEIACGEAPFLVSRYDTVTGEKLDIKDRIGLLDRKLRIVSENTYNEKDWVKWAFEAYKATYGYEWQGDSLLIARENLLFTFVDYYTERFDHYPINEYLIEIAKILSWNLWQMDGLKCVIPYSCKPIPKMQMSIFDIVEPPQECPGCTSNNVRLHSGIYCKIKIWKSNKNIPFVNVQGDKKMKFDFVIGNPPYQASNDREDATRGALPVYHLFLDEAYKLSSRVEMIHPARFLFNAGSTPKEWNKKMLNDPHLKVLKYDVNSSTVFPTTDIKGGIAVTYRDANINYGAIETFSSYAELNKILTKVKRSDFESFSKIVYSRTSYRLTDKMHSDHPEAKKQLSDGHDYDMSSNIFTRLPQIFFETKPNDGNDYISMYGLIHNERCYRYVRRDYVNNFKNLDTYKVFVPQANGSGAIGEVLSTPVIGQPVIGHTETFLSIGCLSTKGEAEAVLKYIKTKFMRTLLGILKVTQNNPPSVWHNVPMQDFTDNSDIDWSKSVHEIDLQLYKKYGLDEKEIAFIESHIKEMN